MGDKLVPDPHSSVSCIEKKEKKIVRRIREIDFFPWVQMFSHLRPAVIHQSIISLFKGCTREDTWIWILLKQKILFSRE